jgi:hypothetical protein
MIPAHMQASLHVLLSTGMPPITVVGTPGAHGATVAGTQGIGVGTPSAAAVAAITAGFDGLLHIPNGMTLTIGTWSMIVAAGSPPAMTRLTGNTTKALGAAPKLHAIIAPFVIWVGIALPLLRDSGCHHKRS